jgi:putative peptidoglycan lipid II flippase
MKLAHFLGGAGILALSQVLSRALGVARDHTIAQIFGATGGTGIFQLDTYYAAFRLPDLLYNLLIVGVLSAAFVPLLAEQRDSEAVRRYASNTLNLLLVCTLILAGVLYLLSEPLTALLVPGYTPEATALTAKLLQIQLLAPVAFAASAVFGGLAQHYGRYGYYALAPVLYNLGIIVGALLWGSRYGVVGLAWGTALGAGLHAAIQLPGVLSAGFRWRAIWQPTALRTLVSLGSLRVLIQVLSQIGQIAIVYLASLIGVGALAVYQYAWNLASLPWGVVGVAVATTSYGTLARLASADPRGYHTTLRDSLTKIWFWVIPASAGLLLLSTPLTQLVLAGGSFTTQDTWLVSEALQILALGVPFVSSLPLLNNAYFARKNTRTPLWGALLGLVVLLLCGRVLAADPAWGSSGLALALTLSYVVGTVWLYRQLARTLPSLTAWVELAKTLAGTAIMSGSVWCALLFWPSATTTSMLLVQVLGLATLGGALYLGTMRLLSAQSLSPLLK